jgi:uncharacterized repeat protein (TIGR03803 family)
MAKLQGWRIGFVAFMLFAVMAIASPAQTFQTLLRFDGHHGAEPYGALVQGTDGNFYGTSAGGGVASDCPYACGTVFKITPSGKFTELYHFCSQTNCADGSTPTGALVLAKNGNFYGTTRLGGANHNDNSLCFNANAGCGTVFEITPTGELTTVYSFCARTNCTDGTQPNGLVQDANGNFYGTALSGGAYGQGTVFEISPAGKLTTLYSFCPGGQQCTDGAEPNSTLVQGTDGSFYGSTEEGGSQFAGVIFKITPAGKMTTLHAFCSEKNCADGDIPYGTLVQANNGNFHGTTWYGGNKDGGIVYEITPAGKLSTIYSFCSEKDCTDGVGPLAGLVQATDGNFYGTTTWHGANCIQICGTTFKLTPTGSLTTLHTFYVQRILGGWAPEATLLQATNGNFYGSTFSGGRGQCTNGCGTLFGLSVGLSPFVAFVRSAGKVGATAQILGQGLTGTTGVSFNGTGANFVVHSDTHLTATVPQGATTGFVTVTTPSGTLQSNVVFRVTP